LRRPREGIRGGVARGHRMAVPACGRCVRGGRPWFLPEVVASSADPLLMITRRVPGTSLFEVAGSIDPDHAAR
jgi:hypothetical protein